MEILTVLNPRGRAYEKYGLKNKITAPYGVLSFVPDCEFERKLVLPDSVEFVFSADYKSDGGLKNKL